jgi:hypothetical protein
MKSLFIFSTIILNLCLIGRSQNNLEEFNLKGEVRSIKTTKSFAVTDSLGKEIYIPEQTSLSTFNKNGNLIREEIDKIIPNVRTTTIINYKYNSNDKLIEIVEKDSSYSFKTDYKIPGYKYARPYDENWSDVEKQKTIFRYNSINQRIIKYNYPENLLRDSTIYEYDEKNNLIKETKYYLKSEGYWYTKYKYDNNNRLIEKNSGDKERLYTKNIYEYDIKGRIIEDSTYIFHEPLVSYLNSVSAIKYRYNNNNEVIESIETSSMGSNTISNSYKYEDFDIYGNWTKKVESFDNMPVQLINFLYKREIEYYE